MDKKIALLAGNGKFPILFARVARDKGVEVVAIGINKETSRELEGIVSKIYWLGPGELGRLLEILKKEKITSIVMAGQVKHKSLFDKTIKIDERMRILLDTVKDKKTDSLIVAITEILEQQGMQLLDSTTFLKDYLPDRGVLTESTLDKKVLEDIEFGKAIAKSIAGLDIGQSVVVKDKVVLAVESIEGTDEAVKRAAFYGKEGIVVIKVSKPKQDMRFDVPIIGPDTIELLGQVKAACIAIEAKKTLIIDKEETIRLANETGVGVVAI